MPILVAGRRWQAAGRTVSVHMAPQGMDWADVALANMREAAE